MDTTNQHSDGIIDLVDRALREAADTIDGEHAIAMLDRNLEELELLEARIGKAVVAIDDLRGLFAARRKQVSQR